MGTLYTSQAAVNYNASPPPDDGSQGANNQITWGTTIKGKIGDPIKALADAINSQLTTVLDLSPRAISTNDSAVASDHWRTLQVTGTTTITLSDAATMTSKYVVGIANLGTNTVTVTRATAGNTINGTASDFTLLPKQAVVLGVNNAANGYNILSASNASGAGIQSLIAGTIDSSTGSLVLKGAGTTAQTITGANTVFGGTIAGSTGTVPLVGATGSSGTGIAFPSAQSASSDVNTLDDYSEGTWAPSLGGNTTYTAKVATFTKIGRLVFITADIEVNAQGTGSTTVIQNLPFTIGSITPIFAVDVNSSATSVVDVYGLGAGSGTTITLWSRTAASASPNTNAIFQNGTVLKLSGCYSV